MIRESTALGRDEHAFTLRSPRWTIALAALALAAGLAIGLFAGLNWPDATTSTGSPPAATGNGEVAHPDDYLARYLARHQPGATPADDYLARYLIRHQADVES